MITNFVINEQYHGPKSRYKSHDILSNAFAEAKRLSEKHENQEFTIMEAKPIGKMMNGDITWFDTDKAEG